MQVAKNRALDHLRRDAFLRDKSDEVVRAFAPDGFSSSGQGQSEARLAGELPPPDDDRLAMMFMTCHPALARESRVALTLKVVAGLSVGEIARAFLSSEAAIAQRLVRAKRQPRDEDVPMAVPPAQELPARLDSVLEAVYLLFSEGYTAHDGDALVRFDLSDEAIRLGALVAAHPATAVPKAHALLALMLLQAARLPARTGEDGELRLLADQDRSLWDRRLIALGFQYLDRSAAGHELSEYHLEAAIAACHASAPTYARTDWARIVDLYDELLRVNPSPVVALQRAIALSRLSGPRAGLAATEALAGDPTLERYYLLHATIGELWRELGDAERAAAAFRRALDCGCSAPERRFLEKKIQALEPRA